MPVNQTVARVAQVMTRSLRQLLYGFRAARQWSLRERYELYSAMLPATPPIFSRAAAVAGAVAWIVGLIGILLGMFGIAAGVVLGGDPVTRSVTILACELWVFSFVVISFQESWGLATPQSTIPKAESKSRPSRRETWIFRIVSGAFIILFILTVDWTSSRNYQVGALLAIGAGALVTTILSATVTWWIELHLRMGERVIIQFRGWNRLPFDEWTADDHRAAEGASNFNRSCPPPAGSSGAMSVDEARNYAVWAAAKADQRWILSQVLVLLGSITAAMALPILLGISNLEPSKYSKDLSLIVFGGGIILATLGIRVSVTTVAIWKRRAAAYRVHVEAGLIPHPHDTVVLPVSKGGTRADGYVSTSEFERDDNQ